MKIDKNYHPELLVSKDKYRESIHEPSLEGEKIISTDGYYMGIFPVTKEIIENTPLDEDGYIPCEVLKTIKGDTFSAYAGKIHVNGNTYSRNGSELKFPAWKEILPKKEPIVEIAFDIDRLTRLAKALGSRIIKLRIRGITDIIEMIPDDPKNKAIGYLMPYLSNK